MLSWADVVATLGLVLLAIIGGYLKVLPDKVVAAMITAACGYFAARTAIKAKKEHDKKKRESPSGDDGAPVQELDLDDSGVVEIAPQLSGRVVRVLPDGSVRIRGPEERLPFSEPDGDRTPVERNRNLPPTDDEEKAS